MTEIERKALALVNEVRTEWRVSLYDEFSREGVTLHEALCRAIEQHEAYKREVSCMVVYLKALYPTMPTIYDSFILPKPVDPLVEVWDHMIETGNFGPIALRAAIEKRGGKIVWGEGA